MPTQGWIALIATLIIAGGIGIEYTSMGRFSIWLKQQWKRLFK